MIKSTKKYLYSDNKNNLQNFVDSLRNFMYACDNNNSYILSRKQNRIQNDLLFDGLI